MNPVKDPGKGEGNQINARRERRKSIFQRLWNHIRTEDDMENGKHVDKDKEHEIQGGTEACISGIPSVKTGNRTRSGGSAGRVNQNGGTKESNRNSMRRAAPRGGRGVVGGGVGTVGRRKSIPIKSLDELPTDVRNVLRGSGIPKDRLLQHINLTLNIISFITKMYYVYQPDPPSENSLSSIPFPNNTTIQTTQTTSQEEREQENQIKSQTEGSPEPNSTDHSPQEKEKHESKSKSEKETIISSNKTEKKIKKENSKTNLDEKNISPASGSPTSSNVNSPLSSPRKRSGTLQIDDLGEPLTSPDSSCSNSPTTPHENKHHENSSEQNHSNTRGRHRERTPNKDRYRKEKTIEKPHEKSHDKPHEREKSHEKPHEREKSHEKLRIREKSKEKLHEREKNKEKLKNTGKSQNKLQEISHNHNHHHHHHDTDDYKVCHQEENINEDKKEIEIEKMEDKPNCQPVFNQDNDREPLDDLMFSQIAETAIRWTENPKKDYRIGRQFAKGGFGVVFEGKDLEGKRVAIKVVSHVSERDKRTNIREVGALIHFKHQNIVQYIDSYKLKDDIWIIMEFMEGGTLTQAVELHSFTESEIAYVSREILRALAFIHSRDYIHRDLKSSNIMITTGGQIKLIDFGLCCHHTLGQRKKMAGSPYWMPPEMILRETYSFPIDVWSFAICVLEMANRRPPNRQNKFRAMFIVGSEGCPHPLNDPKSWSTLFYQFLCSCLQFDPTKRLTPRQLLKHEFIEKAEAESDMRNMLSGVFVQQHIPNFTS